MNYREYLKLLKNHRNSLNQEPDQKCQNGQGQYDTTGGLFKNQKEFHRRSMFVKSKTAVIALSSKPQQEVGVSVSKQPQMAAHTLQRHRLSCTHGILRHQSQYRGKYPVLRQPNPGETDSDVEEEYAFKYYEKSVLVSTKQGKKRHILSKWQNEGLSDNPYNPVKNNLNMGGADVETLAPVYGLTITPAPDLSKASFQKYANHASPGVLKLNTPANIGRHIVSVWLDPTSTQVNIADTLKQRGRKVKMYEWDKRPKKISKRLIGVVQQLPITDIQFGKVIELESGRFIPEKLFGLS